MTAQWPDRIEYCGRSFEMSWGGPRFEPEDYGILPAGMIHTGLMRGYFAKYAIDERNRLILKNLDVCAVESNGDAKGRETTAPLDNVPPLNGVAPDLSENGFAYYENVGLQFDYTGSLLIGGNFRAHAKRPYIDGRFLETFDYGEMWELDFKNGVLETAVDRSENAARLGKLLARPTLRVKSVLKNLFPWWLRQQTLRLKGIELYELSKYEYILEFQDGKLSANVFPADDGQILEFSSDKKMFEFLDDKEKRKLLKCESCEFPNGDLLEIRKFWDENREFRKILETYEKLKSDELSLALAKVCDSEDCLNFLNDVCRDNSGGQKYKIFVTALILTFGEDFFAKWFLRR